MGKFKRLLTVGPAVAMTIVSMVLTLAVVVMWLGESMPWAVALVVGLGLDGGWLATLAYERRLAAQGDHSRGVTAVGWLFGAAATGVLVAHALTVDGSAGAWLAVAWLPIGAKALWLVHGLWERTALTPAALDAIRSIQQTARDEAAVARAQLRAEAGTEETRLEAVTAAGARVARVQARTAERLSGAWSTLEAARQGDGTGRALTCVTDRVTPESQPRWELPVWGPVEPVAALEAAPAGAPDEAALSDAELDVLVSEIRHSDTPPLSYREMAARFRAAGHSAGEVRLRSAWKRVTAEPTTA
ncbi:MAG TPA: protein spdB [Streptomyces sp.]|nr:protein spdB [Streptomyces sp.]